MSLFDEYKKGATDAVSSVMGSVAVWIPSDGSQPAGLNADVLFKNPTKDQKLNGIDYDPSSGQMVFHKDCFPGLFTAVRDGRTETIIISGTRYLVETVHAKWDGDLMMSELVLSDTQP